MIESSMWLHGLIAGAGFATVFVGLTAYLWGRTHQIEEQAARLRRRRMELF